MQSWSKITHYAGFDWAHDHHEVVIVDRSGKIVADFQIEHTAQGWQRWREQVAAGLPKPKALHGHNPKRPISGSSRPPGSLRRSWTNQGKQHNQ
jgi:hypothetical protein